MFAQNFKTPADLGINDAEFEALLKVLGMLERGDLKHQPDDNLPIMPNGFSMNTWLMESRCGTLGCIKGWARVVSRDYELFADYTRNDTVYGLFTVDHLHEKPWSEISTEEAAIALRNYLTSGEPRWAEALAE